MDNYTYFTATGRIQYDPKRPGMRKVTRASGASNLDWWCVLLVDREITRYYRWWVQRHLWAWTAVQPNWLCQPSWDGHVSIVRGETPRANRDMWRKYQDEKVEFQYAHYPRRTTMDDRERRYSKDGDFWFVNVTCPRIDEIRSELGLRSNFRYHLTVGRTYDNR